METSAGLRGETGAGSAPKGLQARSSAVPVTGPSESRSNALAGPVRYTWPSRGWRGVPDATRPQGRQDRRFKGASCIPPERPPAVSRTILPIGRGLALRPPPARTRACFAVYMNHRRCVATGPTAVAICRRCETIVSSRGRDGSDPTLAPGLAVNRIRNGDSAGGARSGRYRLSTG